MIAQVRVADDSGDGYTVTLDDEARWTSEDFPEVADSLNILHAGTFAEWNGPAGPWQARDAADRLSGEIVYLRS